MFVLLLIHLTAIVCTFACKYDFSVYVYELAPPLANGGYERPKTSVCNNCYLDQFALE